MKLLLDTCTFLWLVRGDQHLSDAARAAIEDTGSEVFVSAVTAWEIGIKSALGKLPLPEPARLFVPTQRRLHQLEALAVGEDDSLAAAGLPPLHKDPFDRLLVGQAQNRGLTLLTPDPLIQQYPGISVQW